MAIMPGNSKLVHSSFAAHLTTSSTIRARDHDLASLWFGLPLRFAVRFRFGLTFRLGLRLVWGLGFRV